MAGKIRTVTGDIDPPDGAMLIHEHLQIDLSHNKGPQTVLSLDDVDDVVHDLKVARSEHGLALIAEMSVMGSGRDVVAMKRISEASGVAAVAATGYYWEPVHPDAIAGDIETLRRAMVREIEVGVGDTGIRCGVIKVGTDAGEQPEAVERVFKAAALASRDTGAAIITHTTTADQAQWQIDQLESGGADLSRVLISHLHNSRSHDELLRYVGRGVNFGFDQIGFAKGLSFEQYADLIALCMREGLGDRNFISTDVARRGRLTRHGGDSYATMFTRLLPLLAGRGVGASHVSRLLNANPARLLALVN